MMYWQHWLFEKKKKRTMMSSANSADEITLYFRCSISSFVFNITQAHTHTQSPDGHVVECDCPGKHTTDTTDPLNPNLRPSSSQHTPSSEKKTRSPTSWHVLQSFLSLSSSPSFPFVSSISSLCLEISAKFLSESSVFYSSPTLLQIRSQTVVICARVKAERLLASFTI